MRSITRLSVWADRRGDTIIEVLIAIGIVSLVLTSAYAVTNRNAQASQKIQEQGQAQKIVESQIELLRSYSNPSGIPPNGCLTADGDTIIAVGVDSCKNFQADGSGATYVLSINKLVAPAVETYKVTAVWDALGGQSGNVTMYYRR